MFCGSLIALLEQVLSLYRGSYLTSRLANYYPERFLAFAFLSIGYQSPGEGMDIQAVMNYTKRTFGYENFGYWSFFSEEGTDTIIEEHVCGAFMTDDCATDGHIRD
jgi:hypothetical protein